MSESRVDNESAESRCEAGADSGRALVDPLDLMTSLIARIVLGCFFFFVFVIGMWVAGTSLHDPDTCWLLGVGAWIAQNGAVPMTDPWSYTMGDRPFVAYQWLTELLFFASYKLFGGHGLVALTNLIVVFAFIVVPLKLFQRWKSSMWAGVAVCTLAVMAGSFHFLARPEIVTYLFLSIWFALLAVLRQSVSEKRIGFEWKLAGSFAILMMFWANMHSGFVLALIALAAFALVNTIEFAVRKLPLSVLATSWVSLILSAVATLLNPRGFGLWQYLPNQLFFTGFNKYIVELKPLGLMGLLEPTFVPTLVLCICVIIAQLWDLRRALLAAKGGGELPIGIAFSPVLTIIAFVSGTIARRMIPFSCVFLACELAWLLRGTGGVAATGAEVIQAAAPSTEIEGTPAPASSTANQAAVPITGAEANQAVAPSTETEATRVSVPADATKTAGATHAAVPARNAETAMPNDATAGISSGVSGNRLWWQQVSDKVGRLLSSGRWRYYVVALSLFGVLVTSTRITAPTVPQGTTDTFYPPFMAIQFLSKLAPDGKCLNDPQYGDMVIWYLHSDVKPLFVEDPLRLSGVDRRPKVFIDTRFDMYGSALVDDYNIMAQTLSGWEERFAKYDFDWVFVPSNWKIADALRDEGWKTIFDDKFAVVLSRPGSNAELKRAPNAESNAFNAQSNAGNAESSASNAESNASSQGESSTSSHTESSAGSTEESNSGSDSAFKTSDTAEFGGNKESTGGDDGQAKIGAP